MNKGGWVTSLSKRVTRASSEAISARTFVYASSVWSVAFAIACLASADRGPLVAQRLRSVRMAVCRLASAFATSVVSLVKSFFRFIAVRTLPQGSAREAVNDDGFWFVNPLSLIGFRGAGSCGIWAVSEAKNGGSFRWL